MLWLQRWTTSGYELVPIGREMEWTQSVQAWKNSKDLDTSVLGRPSRKLARFGGPSWQTMDLPWTCTRKPVPQNHTSRWCPAGRALLQVTGMHANKIMRGSNFYPIKMVVQAAMCAGSTCAQIIFWSHAFSIYSSSKTTSWHPEVSDAIHLAWCNSACSSCIKHSVSGLFAFSVLARPRKTKSFQ